MNIPHLILAENAPPVRYMVCPTPPSSNSVKVFISKETYAIKSIRDILCCDRYFSRRHEKYLWSADDLEALEGLIMPHLHHLFPKKKRPGRTKKFKEVLRKTLWLYKINMDATYMRVKKSTKHVRGQKLRQTYYSVDDWRM